MVGVEAVAETCYEAQTPPEGVAWRTWCAGLLSIRSVVPVDKRTTFTPPLPPNSSAKVSDIRCLTTARVLDCEPETQTLQMQCNSKSVEGGGHGGRGGGVARFSSGPQAPGRGQGGPEGGGQFFFGGGAVLNSLFHLRHFEYTQIRGIRSPFTLPHKWGGGHGGWSVSRSTEVKKIFRAPLGPSRWFLIVHRRCGLGGPEGGGGVRSDT